MELVLDSSTELFESAHESVHLAFLNINNSFSISSDSISLAAAYKFKKLIITEFRIEETCDYLYGISPFFIDVVTAVSAECIGNLETYSLISWFYRFGSIIENRGSVDSAGATHENLSFILRIEVDQCL